MIVLTWTICSWYLCFWTNSKVLLTVVAKRVGSVGGAWIGAGAGTPGGRDTLWGIAGVEGVPKVIIDFFWYNDDVSKSIF